MPRAALLTGSLALLATTTVVSLGVLDAEPASSIVASDAGGGDSSATAADLGTDRSRSLEPLSRSAVRGTTLEEKPTLLEKTMAPQAVAEAVAGADTKRFSTTLLNLWSGPSEDAVNLGTLEPAKPVTTTGRTLMGRTEIVLDDKARWVTNGYLAEDKPEPAPEEREVGDATCTNGSSVPAGVSPNIVAVHEAVCAAFPQLTTYGTFRSDGEHAQGLAIDIMVSGQTGYDVAEFVKANYAELGVNYIMYSQQIWSVDRSSEGWRGVEDRGSITANHYDHVHVTTY